MTEPVCKFEQGCHRVVACDPGCGATSPAPEQPARHSIDTITQAALNQLYADLDSRTREAARWQAGHERAEALLHHGRRRLAELEAAIGRVRAECDRLTAVHSNCDGAPLTARDEGVHKAVRRVRTALDEPAP